MVGFRPSRDPESGQDTPKHVGLHPHVLRCFMDSDEHHENYHDLCTKLHRFCGRHRVVANAELWSSTLARFARDHHKVSPLHLSLKTMSGIRFGEVLAPSVGDRSDIFEAHHRHIFDNCKPLNTVPRFEDAASSQTAETGLRETEWLGPFRDTARELTHFFRTSGTATDVDQSTADAAKDPFHTLLGEVSDYLADVMPKLERRRCRSDTPSELQVVPDLLAESARSAHGDWRHLLKLATLTTPVLNAFVDEAGRQGKTRNIRTYFGAGSSRSVRSMEYGAKRRVA